MRTANVFAGLFALILVAVLGLPSGCSDSGGRRADSGGGNPPSCTMSGTWSLISMSCGSTDITAAWKARVTSSVVTLTGGANGECHGVLVNTGPNCQETDEYDASLSGETETDSAAGITVCNPSGCQFDPNDAPCVVGDRAGTSTETTVISGSTMTMTSSGAQSLCGALPTTQVWTRQ
ncbi:MAG TPA: hypothetical protein VJ801_12935 [Polyangia bacterium]|jgi:hypothetical protein|nr:hypothetical protein [Polyangia bacterium]